MNFEFGEDFEKEFGASFSFQELKDYSDFRFMIESFNFPKDLLNEYLEGFLDDSLIIGHRLYLVLNLGKELLGKFLLKEIDSRLIEVAKKRCFDYNKGSGIILKG